MVQKTIDADLYRSLHYSRINNDEISFHSMKYRAEKLTIKLEGKSFNIEIMHSGGPRKQFSMEIKTFS